jgi:hypothetical protein
LTGSFKKHRENIKKRHPLINGMKHEVKHESYS